MCCSTLAAFHFWRKQQAPDGKGAKGEREGLQGGGEAGKQEAGQLQGEGEPGDLNMMSAFLHVFADSLRSFTTLVEVLFKCTVLDRMEQSFSIAPH